MTGWRRGTDRAYAYIASLFMLGVFVQFFLAGVGVFGDHASKVQNASSLDPHRALGNVLGAIALILLILALVTRESGKTMLWTFVLALLTVIAQPALAGGGENNKWVGGLHAFDGVLILVLGGVMTRFAHQREAARRRGAAPAADAAPAAG